VSFTEAVRSVFKNYAKFDGRAPRSEYWWFQLFNLLFVLGAYAVMIALVAVTRSYAVLGVAILALGVYAIVSLIPSLAVTVRRLHDTEKSGWWLLIALVPYVGALILLIFMVLPSSLGFNRFGPPYGETGEEQRARYSGPTRSETLMRFADDAREAAAAGFEPVWQQWQSYPGGETLDVTYKRRPSAQADPPWRPPTSQGPQP
jgi:uncharacterized membrane protein YhaH (DUF805 family)